MRTPLPSDTQLQMILAPFALRAAIVFGSVARGDAGPESDLDIAVLGDEPLSANDKIAIIDALALALGRPVDLIDLWQVGEPLLGRILAEGRQIMGTSAQWAGLLSRHLGNQADFVPLQERVLQTRRAAWIAQ